MISYGPFGGEQRRNEQLLRDPQLALPPSSRLHYQQTNSIWRPVISASDGQVRFAPRSSRRLATRAARAKNRAPEAERIGGFWSRAPIFINGASARASRPGTRQNRSESRISPAIDTYYRSWLREQQTDLRNPFVRGGSVNNSRRRLEPVPMFLLQLTVVIADAT